MKYQIRLAEEMTVWLASESIELDPKKFKKLEENPYTGKTPEEFIKYISSLDFYDLPYDLDEDTADKLTSLYESPRDEINNSAQKAANQWFEIGEKNEEYRRTGGFRIDATSND